MSGEILSVNVARMRLIQVAGQTVKTGIYKYPVDDRRMVENDLVSGDEQADLSVHGGPRKAVYAYAREDYEWWETELGRELPAGEFGENLTLRGIDCNGAVIGELWRAGDAQLVVTEPRIPCGKFAFKMGEDGWQKRFARADRPGCYLAIAGPGQVGSGDTVEVIDRPGHGVTILDFARAMLGDREPLPRLLEVPDIAPEYRQWLERRAAETGD